jgi:glutamate synthase domain-containing protein 1
MHDRSNGLGGGFAAYGIYPEYADYYAFHVFFDNIENANVQSDMDLFLQEHFDVKASEPIPTRKVKAITKEPIIWRYFVAVKPDKIDAFRHPHLHPKIDLKEELEADPIPRERKEEEYVAQCVLNINEKIAGAYVFSSGKNVGVFKGVGYPEDIGEFYKLEEYKGYAWDAHGRYPTNTPGWWGGSHPFALLDYTIVHNGEISSYDANRRFIEMYGYKCSLLTDTEVITYIFDFLNRKRHLSLADCAKIVAAPFWKEIEESNRYTPEEREKLTYFRNNFGSLLITGPFSIILGHKNGFMALNDRLKLRSMVAAEKGKTLYIASEECAIRAICPDPERIWSPKGGEAIIAEYDK